MRHVVYINKVRLDAPLPAVNFTLGNAWGLAEAGARCTLIARSSGSDFDTGALLEQFGLESHERLQILTLLSGRRFGIRTNQWFYLDAVRRILDLHSDSGISAVISRDPGALPYLKRIRRKTGIPAFYQPHNFYADLSGRHDVNRTNARKYRWLERRYIPAINGVLCLQPSQSALFARSFPDQYIVASPPGVLKLFPRREPPARLRQIVYVGSLQLKKGMETLLQALVRLDSDFHLSLVGGRNDREIGPVRERISGLGLQSRTEITGWLPYGEVADKLGQAAIGILPLEDTFYNRYLTAPNKLFDYLSRGIPVVASDLPAVRDFLTEAEGVFVPPGDPDRLARAVSLICSDRTAYRERSQCCLKKAGESLWKIRAGEMLQHIENSF